MVPDAPWTLSGELVVCLLRLRERSGLAAVPEGIARMPGPAVLWAGHWAQTPVGPFSEVGLAVPARVGLRPGWSVVLSAVTSPDARVAGALSWGVPRQLADLRWLALDQRRVARWQDRDVEVQAHVRGRPAVPLAMGGRGLQRRGDGEVLVPLRLVGWLRRADVEITVPAGDPLEPLAGIRRGWLLSGRQLVLQPARRPTGLLGSLLAPLRAEPAPGSTRVGRAPLPSD